MVRPALPAPAFIDCDPNVITSAIIAQYETDSGKTLYPAQVDRLMINNIAYRETLVREGVQNVAMQNLLYYATYPVLDYLGDLVDCPRVGALPATTTLLFTLPAAAGIDTDIPMGTLAAAQNGAPTFSTNADAVIPAGQLSVSVGATCVLSGSAGNGWALGQINVLVSVLPVTVAVSNTTVTGGGADQQTDDEYRASIQLAPASFSVAGPEAGYQFWAQSAYPDIVAVAVDSPSPCVINVYPLLSTGLPDAAVLALVEAALQNNRQIRPLTDQVSVLAPGVVTYSINATLTFNSGVDPAATLASAQTAANAYAAAQAAAFGLDIVPSQIVDMLSVAGVYEVVLSAPTAVAVVGGTSIASCLGINLIPGGVTSG
jgi:phage-related baseplate assembly protein